MSQAIGYYCCMPSPRPIAIDKSALNALVDLYYLYGDLVNNVRYSDESPQEIDVFYLRGGLKDMLEKYYTLSGIDPVVAGGTEDPLTLERMLPRPTISAVVDVEAFQMSRTRGTLKGFFNEQNAYGAEIPEDAKIVIGQGRVIIASRIKRSRSSSNAALVDLPTALIAYEELKLKIGNEEFPIRRNSLGDYVLEYMINCCNKNDVVDRDTILAWITEQTRDDRTTTKSIYDKCNDINRMVQDRLATTLKLFDTSADNNVKRNY